MKKKIFICLLFIMTLFLMTGCSEKPNPIVSMDIKDYGTIKIELMPKYAKNTVANFVNLIEEGFYDNNTIHRIQKNFVVQGGDPTAKGNGGPGYAIKGEFSQNGFTNNTLSHTKGVISMARSNHPDSAGSQFFIVLDDNAKYSLDGMYAAFGKVIEGIDVLDKLNSAKFEYTDSTLGILKNPLTIEKVTVETFGVTYKVKKINITKTV